MYPSINTQYISLKTDVFDIQIDEPDLVRRFNERDIEAFGAVYGVFYNSLIYYTSKLYDNTFPDPGDIIHDVFLKLWNSPANRFSNLSEIKAYLFVSIKNSRKTLSTHVKHIEQYAENQRSDNVQFRANIIETEVFSLFHNALKLLPEESAQILDMFFKGWKAEEIAEKLGKNKQTIYNKKSEALSELKRKMPKDIFSLLFSGIL